MGKINVTGCEECPFCYDYYECQHPDVEDAKIIDIDSLPELCPLRDGDVWVGLKK